MTGYFVFDKIYVQIQNKHTRIFGEFIMKTQTFWQKYKKAIIDLVLLLVAVVAISLVTLLLLMAFDIVYISDGVHFSEEVFHSFRTSWYGWIIFSLIMTVLTILLCVIPGASMAFILLTQAIYPIAWEAFVLSVIRVMFCSALMYAIGYFGGYRLCVKFLGKDDCEKALGLLRDKGTVYFPLMMMFPVFPDDALVMIAGTLKMSLKWFIPSIIIGRGIGIATIVFGLGSIPFEKFTSIWHWIAFILLCIIGIAIVFFAAHKFNKYMDNKRKIKTAVDEKVNEKVEEATEEKMEISENVN